jgi:hypothetical protein
MKFMAIVKATAESEKGMMPSESKLEEMAVFNETLVKAGVMLDGAGLQPSSRGARVRFSGDKKTVINGPFPETRELVAGFWVIEAASLEEAVDWFTRAPNPAQVGDGEIEIRPFFGMDDFGESDAVDHHRRVADELARKA